MSASNAQENQNSAGALLKNLRLEKELSVADVAAKLRLEPRIIAALEADDFAILPAATYARGYLRNYARLLGADADAIIALYDDEAPAPPPEIVPAVRHPTQTSSSDTPVKAFSYLISLVLVLLFLAWWQSEHIVETPVEATNAASTASAPAAAEENAPTSAAPEADDGAAAEEEYADEIDDGEAVEEERTGDTIDPGAATSPAAEGDAAAEDLTATAAAPNPAIATEMAAPAPLQDDEIIDRRGVGPDEVSITLNADSWVEVFEADGAELYLDLARNGQTLILQGRAPFRILLGFSAGALVRFNGEQIDHAPYARASIARFSVSSAGTSSIAE